MSYKHEYISSPPDLMTYISHQLHHLHIASDLITYISHQLHPPIYLLNYFSFFFLLLSIRPYPSSFKSIGLRMYSCYSIHDVIAYIGQPTWVWLSTPSLRYAYRLGASTQMQGAYQRYAQTRVSAAEHP